MNVGFLKEIVSEAVENEKSKIKKNRLNEPKKSFHEIMKKLSNDVKNEDGTQTKNKEKYATIDEVISKLKEIAKKVLSDRSENKIDRNLSENERSADVEKVFSNIEKSEKMLSVVKKSLNIGKSDTTLSSEIDDMKAKKIVEYKFISGKAEDNRNVNEKDEVKRKIPVKGAVTKNNVRASDFESNGKSSKNSGNEVLNIPEKGAREGIVNVKKSSVERDRGIHPVSKGGSNASTAKNPDFAAGRAFQRKAPENTGKEKYHDSVKESYYVQYDGKFVKGNNYKFTSESNEKARQKNGNFLAAFETKNAKDAKKQGNYVANDRSEKLNKWRSKISERFYNYNNDNDGKSTHNLTLSISSYMPDMSNINRSDNTNFSKLSKILSKVVELSNKMRIYFNYNVELERVNKGKDKKLIVKDIKIARGKKILLKKIEISVEKSKKPTTKSGERMLYEVKSTLNEKVRNLKDAHAALKFHDTYTGKPSKNGSKEVGENKSGFTANEIKNSAASNFDVEKVDIKRLEGSFEKRNELNPGEIVRRVADTIVRRSNENSFKETATLRMYPPKLGEVEVTIVKSGNSVEVKFKVFNKDAHDALQKSIHLLTSRLNSQGFTLDKVEVTQENKEDLPENYDENERNNHSESQRESNRENQKNKEKEGESDDDK
ncbi:MAG: flagellar hook-length control protein FliK [Thermotogaceae bacterium]|nr:flagellar hook-length control protein FliK [Thermotogaceae bacterium]